MKTIASADVGGTAIKLALVRDDEICARAEIPAEAEIGLACALERMMDAWKELCSRIDMSFDQIAAFGISFPGVVDLKTERIWVTPKGKFDDARTLDLHAWAATRLKRPLVVANDANAALIAESQFGAGRGYRNAVMMTLGTGVGTSVIMDGNLLLGAHGMAGNAGGHVTINSGGRICLCGNIGCVESEASSWAIRLQASAHSGLSSSKLSAVGLIDYKAVFELAQAGDEVAREIRDHSLRSWAIGATNLVNNFDPEIVIIGGGVGASAASIIPYIANHVRQHSWAQWEVPVVAAKLGNDAGMLGVAHLVGLKS